ncbi:MAG: hypothetical protein KGQ60_15090 [Planctomycetes bacterium]|nr:hypothetical protein [Planctomycetota bacterium]
MPAPLRLNPIQEAVVALLYGLLVTGPVCAQEFSWKFQPDETVQVVMDQRTEMAVVGKAGTKAAVQQTVELHWKVLGVDREGTTDLKQSVQRITIRGERASERFAMDSETVQIEKLSPWAKTFWSEVHPLVGRSWTLRVKPSGEVLPNSKETAREPEFKLISNSSSMPEPLERWSTVGLRFPQNGVHVGEPWNEVSVQIVGEATKIRLLTTYQYLGEEEFEGRLLHRIKTTTSFRLLGDSPNVKLKKQDAMGSIWFDSKTGRIVQSENAQEFILATLVDGVWEDHSLMQSVEARFSPLGR